MLVVMLVLMAATASAALSVHTTQSELKAAGHDRLALQARYASEAAMMTTISWIDLMSHNNDLRDFLLQWQAVQPPVMNTFGEPAIPPNMRNHASRTSMTLQMALQADTVFGCPGSVDCAPPLNQPAPSPGDTIGSFGPRQAYQPDDDYFVDLNDCRQTQIAQPGAPVGGTPQAQVVVQLYCVVTARTQIVIPEVDAAETAGTLATRNWTLTAGDYNQSSFAAAHHSRAAIVTPQMLMPNPN